MKSQSILFKLSAFPPSFFLLPRELSRKLKEKGRKFENPGSRKNERIYLFDRSVILKRPVQRGETTLDESVAQMSLKYGKDYAFSGYTAKTTLDDWYGSPRHGYAIKIAARLKGPDIPRLSCSFHVQ